MSEPPTGPAGPLEPRTLAASPVVEIGPTPFPDVPGYEITAELGRGGMGVVYLARQRQPYRLVALKMILAGAYSAKTDQVRLLLEAEAVAKLVHPNVVAIYQVGRHHGLPFIAMEYCPGGSLTEELTRPIPPRQAALLAETLARAVQAAHAAGVVHRDLKPANVMRTADGTPKLTDFGLAKHYNEDDDTGSTPGGITATGAVLGTPGYMAPEQATGESKRVGPAADIFALGAILYHMLTGRPPFQAANPVDAIVQTVEAEPVPPGRLAGAVPPDLSTICLKCLEKQPSRRYATAADLADDLRRFLDDQPIWAKPASPIERARKWVKRHPAYALALAVGLTALLGGPLAALIISSQLQIERDAAIQAQRDLSQALGETRKAQSQTVELLAFTNLVLAQSFWDQDQILAAKRHLYYVPPHLRDWEWGFLHRVFDGSFATMYGHTAGVRSAALSPDGRRILSGSSDGTAKIWDVDNNDCLMTLEGHPRGVNAVTFNSDGSRAVTAGDDGTVRIWDAKTGRAIRSLGGHDGPVTAMAFSADGQRLATIGQDRTVRLWEAPTGRPAGVIRDPAGADFRAVALSPDGSLLILGCGDGTLRLRPWTSDRDAAVLPMRSKPTTSAISPGGSWLAIGSDTGTVQLWDMAGGRERIAINAHRRAVTAVAVSPDDEWLVTAGDDGLIKVWDARTGRPRSQHKGHALAVRSVAFGHLGDTIVSSSDDATVKLWDIRPVPTRVPVNGPFVMAVSPDGPVVVLTTADRPTELRDARTGRLQLTLDRSAGPITAAAISGDGSRLATAAATGDIDIWDARTGSWTKTLRDYPRTVLALAFGPDADTLASGCDNGEVVIWNVTTGRPRSAVRDSTDPVTAVALTPNGNGLVVGRRNDSVRLWHLPTGRPWLTFHGPNFPVTALGFDHTGRRLVTGREDGSISLWDMATGRDRLTLSGHPGAIAALSFSADGLRLTSVCNDRHVRDWDARPGRELLLIAAHANAIRGLAFSPPPAEDVTGPVKPPRLVSRDVTGTARVWNAETGAAIGESSNVQSAIDSTVVTSPDGRSIAYGYPNGLVRIVRVADEEEGGP